MRGSLKHTFLDILCPQPCVLCEQCIASSDPSYPFCLTCRRYVTFSPIMSRVQAWAHYSLGLYDDVLKQSIQRFKFEGMYDVGTFLAKEFINHWKHKKVFDDVDLICPIPISRQRYFYRGFNQSALLARHIGKALDIPVYEKLLKKIRDIVPQMELKREERLNNVLGAFCLKLKIDLTGKRIILLDDVLTTGSTILECIRIIRQEYPSCTFKIITLAQA